MKSSRSGARIPRARDVATDDNGDLHSVKAIRILIASLAAAATLAMLSVVALAAPNAVGLAASPTGGAAQAEYCPPAERAARQAALKRYTKQMVATRKTYFRKNRAAKTRAAFVKKQQAQLKVLQRSFAACK